MTIQRIDHIGIVVQDLAAAKAFFLDLGLQLIGEDTVGGELVERITGLRDAEAEIAMLRTPDGGTAIELSKFHKPVDEAGVQISRANTLGIRHITFVVDDVDAVVATLKKRGAELVGEMQIYEAEYKLCYIRGPEGIILELAEQL